MPTSTQTTLVPLPFNKNPASEMHAPHELWFAGCNLSSLSWSATYREETGKERKES